MNFLVADSGSTKADWLLVKDNQRTLITTEGINVSQQSDAEIEKILSEGLIPQLPSDLSTIYFYGAGVIGEESRKRLIRHLHVNELVRVEAEGDLLGCARALFGHHQGIACILGTGTNSGAYNGERITENISPGGFILGDEGSGAYLGALLCKAFLRKKLSDSVIAELEGTYGWTKEYLIKQIYSEAQPNKFLASLTHILANFKNDESVAVLIRSAFETFITEHLLQYSNHQSLDIGFVGSIAFYFQEELKTSLNKFDLRPGPILQKPIQQLANFHAHVE